jgi:hypothetical protein
MSELAETLLAKIWNSQWFDQPFETTDGRSVRVVYPGVWTHGFGPDFRDAMLDIDGCLMKGDIEVELDVSGWESHGHDQNETFDRVILQVVARDSPRPLVRRVDGRFVPRVVLTEVLRGSLDEFSKETNIRPLGSIGFETCAQSVAAEHPQLVRAVWQRAGDQRMQEKVATMSGEMAVSAPAQVLYSRIMDALGFSRNREAMGELAARLPVDQLWMLLESCNPGERFWTAAALLLGAGGFLPLSPGDSAAGRLEPSQIGKLESIWAYAGTPWHGIEISPGLWSLARLRPAAHPVRRLLAAATLLSTVNGGIVEHVVRILGTSNSRRSLNQWLVAENPYLGKDHAHELVVNVIIPFALAYGAEADQSTVSNTASELWESLSAGRGNSITRQTREQICGDAGVRIGSARAEQGLIHINRHGCSRMRCYECPVAHLALHYESKTLGDSRSL